MNKKFNVTITGIKENSDVSLVSEKFASLFRIDINKALNIIFKKHTIKNNVDKITADKYRDALDKICVICAIEEIEPEEDSITDNFNTNHTEKNNILNSTDTKQQYNPISQSDIYNLISKYCYSKNQSFQDSMNDACFSRGKNISESKISERIQALSGIINHPEVDNEYKQDAKNQIRFYEDLVSFQEYFHSKGATLSLNDIFQKFRDIRRKINLEYNENQEISLFNNIKSMTNDHSSEYEIIKNYLIYIINKDDPQDVNTSCAFDLPGLLTKFGFEHSEFTQELKSKCFKILKDLSIESFESSIESSYTDDEDNYDTSDTSSSNYKRFAISSSTKREVWQRDQGKCSKCGSRENLEFDHIVPISKGGSNTSRNIELLCQNCNRSKSNKIL